MRFLAAPIWVFDDAHAALHAVWSPAWIGAMLIALKAGRRPA
jgi:hypothetical protein